MAASESNAASPTSWPISRLLLVQMCARRISFAAIGAFAVRAHLRDPAGRLTHDLDVVVAPDELAPLRALLEEQGYRLYDTGTWWRADSWP